MHPPEERNILVRSQGSAHARGARAVEHRSYTPRDRVRLPACALWGRSSTRESAWSAPRRLSVRCRPVPHAAPPQLDGRALPRYGSGPGSIPGRGTCFRSSVGLRAPGCGPGGRGFDSLREHCVVFVRIHRGIDQVADRRAHTPEAVGSNPTPATHALVVEPPVDTPASEAGARDEHASSTLARGTATSRWLKR
jgi:hypothetical protein